MSESQVELDNCRACDEEREYAGAIGGIAFMYRHDAPDGTKDHFARRDGICAVCGVQVFDPAKIRQVLDQINQGEL